MVAGQAKIYLDGHFRPLKINTAALTCWSKHAVGIQANNIFSLSPHIIIILNLTRKRLVIKDFSSFVFFISQKETADSIDNGDR